MRALGPGSISSVLKLLLNVAYGVLWVIAVLLALVTLAAVLFILNPEILGGVTLQVSGETIGPKSPMIAASLLAALLYASGVLLIVGELRRIFTTLTQGDPFHPDNVRRLRLIGVTLALLEIGRYAFSTATAAWLSSAEPGGWSLTAAFSVLVVFVLAEVFREGARLRREAELTI